MSSIASPTNFLVNSPITSSSNSRRKLRTSSAPSPSPRSSSVKCSISSSSSSHPQNPKPSDSNDKPTNSFLSSISKPLLLAGVSASTLLIRLTPLPFSSSPDGPGDFGGNGNFGGNGGSGGGGDGFGEFWEKLFCPSAAIADEAQSEEWDNHGLPADIPVPLNKLSNFKRYKLADIVFHDSRRGRSVGTDDSFFEMVSLRPGGVYTKAMLQKELETLATCGMFEKVSIEGNSKADGTMKIKISFTESTWQSAERFRCINVGLMQQSKPIEVDDDMTEKEKMEYYLSQEREYKRRIKRARPCLLSPSLNNEVLQMLRTSGKVSARLLQRIRDKVQKWYQDEGYACAQVVNFGNLNTKEVVCEVVEGDITKLVIQFQDKLGNVVEGNTQLPVVKRELPRKLRAGQVFNIEDGKLALRNINALSLFSNIEVNPRPDEKNEGGIIVEIKLKELEPKSAEVSTEWSIVPGRGGRPTLASIQPGGTVSFEHRNIKGLNRSVVGSITTSNFFLPQDDLAFKLEYAHPYLDGVTNPRNRTLRTSCFNSRKLSPVFTGGPGVDEVPPIWVDRAGVKVNITEANITRDNTKFINGAVVGERNVFQVDQGLGVGSKFPFFNRHQLTITQFIPLKKVEEGAGKQPPPILVLNGHYGGCVGDLPSYDAFTLGGPYSVRGYNMGELGAARNILELGAEIRVPVKNTHVYAFVEHGNDLGSSKDVKGNPTEVYRRKGNGSSYGAGVKLGLVRAEYAVDHNTGTGALFFRFGERY
ncbi:Protein TOC75-3, chloroplastic [Linum grandiflorum]